MNFKPEKAIAERAEEMLKSGKYEDFLKKTAETVSRDGELGLGSIPIIGDKLELLVERLDDLVMYFKCPDVPMSKKIMILAMVIYIFMPNLPIPFWIDELIVGGLLVKKIRKELDAFRRGEYISNPNVIDMKTITSTNNGIKENPFLNLDDVEVDEKAEVKKNPFLNI